MPGVASILTHVNLFSSVANHIGRESKASTDNTTNLRSCPGVIPAVAQLAGTVVTKSEPE